MGFLIGDCTANKLKGSIVEAGEPVEKAAVQER